MEVLAEGLVEHMRKVALLLRRTIQRLDSVVVIQVLKVTAAAGQALAAVFSLKTGSDNILWQRRHFRWTGNWRKWWRR
ncbi:hypothetical protein HED50_12655 [Ochrobactrum oryzae]|nr:hypothetical protein [Brucella oryzae]